MFPFWWSTFVFLAIQSLKNNCDALKFVSSDYNVRAKLKLLRPFFNWRSLELAGLNTNIDLNTNKLFMRYPNKMNSNADSFYYLFVKEFRQLQIHRTKINARGWIFELKMSTTINLNRARWLAISIHIINC